MEPLDFDPDDFTIEIRLGDVTLAKLSRYILGTIKEKIAERGIDPNNADLIAQDDLEAEAWRLCRQIDKEARDQWDAVVGDPDNWEGDIPAVAILFGTMDEVLNDAIGGVLDAYFADEVGGIGGLLDSAQYETGEVVSIADYIAAQHGIEYLTEIPNEVPDGKIVVHNSVRPARKLGTRGFRAYLTAPDTDRFERCSCGWAPELPEHYRAKPGR